MPEYFITLDTKGVPLASSAIVVMRTSYQRAPQRQSGEGVGALEPRLQLTIYYPGDPPEKVLQDYQYDGNFIPSHFNHNGLYQLRNWNKLEQVFETRRPLENHVHLAHSQLRDQQGNGGIYLPPFEEHYTLDAYLTKEGGERGVVKQRKTMVAALESVILKLIARHITIAGNDRKKFQAYIQKNVFAKLPSTLYGSKNSVSAVRWNTPLNQKKEKAEREQRSSRETSLWSDGIAELDLQHEGEVIASVVGDVRDW